MRPATRIGRTVIFPGGLTARLTLRSYLMFKLGLRHTVIAARDLACPVYEGVER